jgi:hypothetical protein
MPHPAMPSDEVCDRVGEGAWDTLLKVHTERYSRGDLEHMGVIVPPHSLHDYGESGTRVVIACIEDRKRTVYARLASHRDNGVLSATYQLAPYVAALRVERARLAELEVPKREAAE